MKRTLWMEYDWVTGVLLYAVIDPTRTTTQDREIPGTPEEIKCFLEGFINQGKMKPDDAANFYRRVVDACRSDDDSQASELEHFSLGVLERISESGAIFVNCDVTEALGLYGDLSKATLTRQE